MSIFTKILGGAIVVSTLILSFPAQAENFGFAFSNGQLSFGFSINAPQPQNNHRAPRPNFQQPQDRTGSFFPYARELRRPEWRAQYGLYTNWVATDRYGNEWDAVWCLRHNGGFVCGDN